MDSGRRFVATILSLRIALILGAFATFGCDGGTVPLARGPVPLDSTEAVKPMSDRPVRSTPSTPGAALAPEIGDGGVYDAGTAPAGNRASEEAAAAASDDKYPYYPTVVEIRGHLNVEVKYGPPNFGGTPAVDRRDRIYVLKLERPITVGTAESHWYKDDLPVSGITKVQLDFEDPESGSHRPGKLITIRGTLWKQEAANDYYPIVLHETK